MNIDYAEDWPFCPTEEQMLKQHAHLVSEENRLLRDEVDRYRRHFTKLINMHNDAALERDKLRVKLRDAESRISDPCATLVTHGKLSTPRSTSSTSIVKL
ncbi:hypothetical protein ALP73_01793 [Pseudomonas coronafaciens pv. garcae]|uniref:Uncharacterized protein n=1 Tax=Pseudomonas coronafaciens pv. garcae TaxID=251653 RepID=A0AB37QLA1_9PSED|nr:Uncharacterized protein AC511_2144 [Pseudomonas coronafaciens pv. oryzae]QIQ69978.1 hypothetical protein HBB04_00320 [Pseudomonas coronafaciens]RMM83250.1 hypothetical protein ALQ71_00589 [Pseudomonas coronafaciens pv. striafaciens]RMR97885.1 hypothetical protein ALP74_00291 [Pseudomonas coronafaciens pv. garcae]RMS13190.1 hypothetical protein ALP72_00782 [Pseudomonas coronafaciens pv. coronafaciens]